MPSQATAGEIGQAGEDREAGKTGELRYLLQSFSESISDASLSVRNSFLPAEAMEFVDVG